MSVETYFKRPVNARPKAFFLFGTTRAAQKSLMEAFKAGLPATNRTGEPVLVVNISNDSYSAIRRLHEEAERKGYQVTIYVRNGVSIMTESVVRSRTTLGLLKEGFARDIVEVLYASSTDVVRGVRTHVRNIMEAAGPPRPKEPSEVDRIKVKQERETLLTKQRQASELLAAKQRELNKKTREDQQKIADGQKPKSIVR